MSSETLGQNPVNVLISITSFNPHHAQYLTQVLDNYSSSYSDYNLTYVLSTNYPFEFTASNVVRPENKYTLTKHAWNNRDYIVNSGSNFDYIIDSDDDILIPRETFEWYRSHQSLPSSYIPGFSCTEQKDGLTYNLNYDTKSLVIGDTYSTPQIRQHSAAFIVDKERFDNLKNFRTRPIRFSFYDEQAFARTEIYCLHGMTKVLPVNPRESMVLHLPNKYVHSSNRPFSIVP